jgi:crotonobetainyl-CoA:carnitine CoA-transferase CaiB-like acyl-CoA transferase
MQAAGIPMQTGRTLARLAPFGIFAARDGDVALCAPTDVFARALFTAMGAAELAHDPRFATRSQRVAHASQVHADVERWVAGLTCAEVVERLSAAGVPAAQVRGPGQAVVDPRVVSREETVPLSHPLHGEVAALRGSGVPIRFSESRAGHDGAVPFLGQHNREVYAELCDYDEQALSELERDGVI